MMVVVVMTRRVRGSNRAGENDKGNSTKQKLLHWSFSCVPMHPEI